MGLSIGLDAQVSGSVFRDFNADGVKTNTATFNEPFLPGIIITTYNAAGTVLASYTTIGAAYSIPAAGVYNGTLGSNTGGVPSGTAVRIEFTGLVTSDYSGPAGTANKSSIQFVTAPASNVIFGVNYPSDYCQLNPDLAVPCYVNGLRSGGAPTVALLKSPYNSAGTAPTKTELGSKSEVGTTWGVAYARRTKILYSSAFLKRHSDLGPNGLGAIYQVANANTAAPGNPTLLVNLTAQGINVGTAGSRNLGAVSTPNHDQNVFGQIGKIGLGDLEISDDETTLWTVNLNLKTLVRIPIATPTAANIQSYSITDPACTGGTYRPFGLKFYKGEVYVGVICDANTSNDANLRATIYRFNPVTATFTSVLNFPLTYGKGPGFIGGNTSTGSCAQNAFKNWNLWSDAFPTSCAQSPTFLLNPQPILSDIEFDIDGSMIIGFMDRSGHQLGSNNYSTNTGSTTIYEVASSGDILRAYNNNGTFQLEKNVIAGPVNSGAANNQGPGNS
ncbi:MAG: hypothetical protein LH618_12810 [Saprospiraceae bacterium]|nr:hypothetical protein [Saprospiraceae bacterium]